MYSIATVRALYDFQTTTPGDLTIIDSIMGNGTFTAGTVPEPASLTSAGLSGFIIGAWSLARQRRAPPVD